MLILFLKFLTMHHKQQIEYTPEICKSGFHSVDVQDTKY